MRFRIDGHWGYRTQASLLANSADLTVTFWAPKAFITLDIHIFVKQDNRVRKSWNPRRLNSGIKENDELVVVSQPPPPPFASLQIAGEVA